MNPHSDGKAGVRLVSLLVQTSLQELEGLSEAPHQVVRAGGVGGWVGSEVFNFVRRNVRLSVDG